MENAVINSLLRCNRQMSPVRETYPPTEKSWCEGLRFKSGEPKYSDYYILNSPQRKSLVPKLEFPEYWNSDSAKKQSTPKTAKIYLKTPETAESFYSGKASPFKDAKSLSPSQISRYSGRDTSISTVASKKFIKDSMQQIYMSFDDDYSQEKSNYKKEIKLEEGEQNKDIKNLHDNIERYEKIIREGTKNKICDEFKGTIEKKNDNYQDLIEKVGSMKEKSLKLRKAIGAYKKKDNESLMRIKQRLMV